MQRKAASTSGGSTAGGQGGIFSAALWKAVGLQFQPLDVPREVFFYPDEPSFSRAMGSGAPSSRAAVTWEVPASHKRRREGGHVVELPRDQPVAQELAVSSEDTFYVGCRALPSLSAIARAPRRRRRGAQRRQPSAALLASLTEAIRDPQCDDEPLGPGRASGSEPGSLASARPAGAAAAGAKQHGAAEVAASRGGACLQQQQQQQQPLGAQVVSGKLQNKPADVVVTSFLAKGSGGQGSPLSHSAESSQERVFGTSSSPLHDGSGTSAPESNPSWTQGSPMSDE
mmetsp:Transcript_58649/g.128347  ORF Transcript_58649/g.128347 Transcript_58649/m.128347 type:complete len:285 (-) Transcript_58649:549-1403(-)